jgi:hypothetical protein
LLFAAAHTAGQLFTAFARYRKGFEAEFQIAVDFASGRASVGAQHQVFFHRQFRKQAAAFRYQTDA